MTDLFAWCPSCALAGSHHVTDHRPERPNPRAGEHVADIMCEAYAEPIRVIREPDVFPATVGRRCLFCGHEWRELEPAAA